MHSKNLPFIASLLCFFNITSARATPTDIATGTIVQTIGGFGLVFVEGNSGIIYAAPFDPSLGTLTDVTLQLEGVGAAAQEGIFRLDAPPVIENISENILVYYDGLGNGQSVPVGNTSEFFTPPDGQVGSVSADFSYDVSLNISSDLSVFYLDNAIQGDVEGTIPGTYSLFVYSPQDIISPFPDFFDAFDDYSSIDLIQAKLTYTYIYTVPEPASALLLATALTGVAWVRRRSGRVDG